MKRINHYDDGTIHVYEVSFNNLNEQAGIDVLDKLHRMTQSAGKKYAILSDISDFSVGPAFKQKSKDVSDAFKNDPNFLGHASVGV
jgi:hypothetical protein